jgi:hypothetical protein
MRRVSSERTLEWLMTDELIPEDLHRVVQMLPTDVRELLQGTAYSTPGLILGGGFIRSIITGERVSDIDLFGPSEQALYTAATKLAAERGDEDACRMHRTPNAFTVITQGRHPVQFIHRWTYPGPTMLLVDFDFTVAQAVVWFENERWKSRVSKHYYPDLASKRLRYLSPARAEDAGGSLMRVRKFLGRGYHIEAPSLAAVVARLAIGVHQVRENTQEEELAKVLQALLREVDPLRIIDGIELSADPEFPMDTTESTPKPAIDDDLVF